MIEEVVKPIKVFYKFSSLISVIDFGNMLALTFKLSDNDVQKLYITKNLDEVRSSLREDLFIKFEGFETYTDAVNSI